MRSPVLRVLTFLSMGGMSACFINEDALRRPEEDGGVSGPLDAGSAPQADSRPPTDPSCPLDAWEDDDTPKQRRGRPAYSHIYTKGPVKVEGMTACLDDEDWLLGNTLDRTKDPTGAIVRWDASVGPLEVELLDAEARTIPLNHPGDIQERQPGEARLLSAQYVGLFFVRVRASGTVSVPYSVDVYAPFLLH
jgi:hypothetical protein